MFPDSVYSYVARAGFEAEIGQYEVALFDWDEAIKKEPKNADFVVSKVELLLRLKRYDEARAELNKAIRNGIHRGALKEWLEKCYVP
jgi:tetratricopeptide (TPR) repeat protein